MIRTKFSGNKIPPHWKKKIEPFWHRAKSLVGLKQKKTKNGQGHKRGGVVLFVPGWSSVLDVPPSHN